jgi:CheY-like chemotaxis protein
MGPELSKPRAAPTLAGMHIPSPGIVEATQRAEPTAGDVVVLCAKEEVRDVIGYWLSSLPARTVVAKDGYHAAKVMQGGCRLLITDRVLPPWPGLDTFLTLRARHPHLRIAFVESDNLHDDILARVTGASLVLKRPLTRQAVIDGLASTEAAR